MPEIEAFAAKCRDTGIDRAVIVSSNGFTETALTKAKHENVRCHLLQPGGESLVGWAIGPGELVSMKSAAHFVWSPSVEVGNRLVFRDDGSPFDFEREMLPYVEHFSSLPHQRSPECVNEVWYPIPCHDLYVRDNVTGLTYRFGNFGCVVTAEWIERSSAQQTMTYSDLLNNKVIVVSTTVTFPN